MRLNKAKLKTIFSSPLFIFALASLVGGIIFIVFYGFSCLNPQNTNWLLTSSIDLKQHYIGWQFFRGASWAFPVGVIKSLAYPFGLPVTYMDSIPLLAIPFKLFSGVLPLKFQYFGVWSLFCYMAQGGFSALIMRHWTKNKIILLLCSVIFISTPVFMMRLFGHTALSSQWIILAAILTTVEWRKINTTKRQLIVWSALLGSSVLIHPYFVPMVGFFLVVSNILTHKTWIGTIIKFVVPISVFILLFWFIGGFQVSETAGTGLGYLGLNLNSIFDPIGWSRLLGSTVDLSRTNETQNYLGLGVILLMPVAVYIQLSNIKRRDGIRTILSSVNIRYLLIVIIFLIMIILSVSPRIKLGSHIVADIKLPLVINNTWSIFRASARLFWPIYYSIIVYTLAILIRQSKKISLTPFIIFLSFFAFLQFVDVRFSQGAIEQRKALAYGQTNKYQPSLNLKKWRYFSLGRKHMVYLGILDMDHMTDFSELVDVALDGGLTMNTGYYARSPDKKIKQFQDEQISNLLGGKADITSNLYILKDPSLVAGVKLANKYKTEFLNGFYIIY